MATLSSHILSALAFLHRFGIAHCDVKPENICLTSANPMRTAFKLIDFGSAVLKYDVHNSYVQSRWYRAPEVSLGKLLADFPLPTSYFLLPTYHLPLPTAYFPLPTSHFPLPTSYFLLPTSHFPLPTSYFLLPTSHFPLPASHFPLPTTHFPLPTSHFPLPTSHFPLPTTHFPLPTSHYPLPTSYFLLS